MFRWTRILAARERRPDLKVSASPWSPPTWMKVNHRYALAPSWPGQPSNGITPENEGLGTALPVNFELGAQQLTVTCRRTRSTHWSCRPPH